MFLFQDINGKMNLSGDGSVTLCLMSDVKGAWGVLRALRVLVGGCKAGAIFV